MKSNYFKSVKTRQNQNTTQKAKKSSTISFRIDEDYLIDLREEARQKKVSLNTLANQIFGEYLEWQRYVEKFGIISMSRDGFKFVLDSLEEPKLIELATAIAQKAPKEFILFKWKNLDSNNVINFIIMYIGHCGYGRYNYSKNIIDDASYRYSFSIYHNLGKKGTLFLKHFLETLVKSTIERDCQSIESENSLVISFEE